MFLDRKWEIVNFEETRRVQNRSHGKCDNASTLEEVNKDLSQTEQQESTLEPIN